MDIRIGVTYSPKELDIELAEDADPKTLKADIEKSLSDGGIVWLTDRKGHQIGVVVEKLAYIDLGSGADHSRIGFGAL